MKTLFSKVNTSKGSITVEACLILPVFIYAIVAFIYFLQIIFVQENIQAAITQTGIYASQYAFLYEYVDKYKENSSQNENKSVETRYKKVYEEYIKLPNLKEAIIFEFKMREFINEDLINNSCIVGGMYGIRLSQSSFLVQNDMIEIIALYKIRIPVSFLRIGDIPVVQTVKLRAFTGYKPIGYGTDSSEDSNDKDRIVFITRTGSVYHLTRECTYIKLDIKQTIFHILEEQRNESGGKYYPCESCVRNLKINSTQNVYITSQGDRYHSSLSCSKLKRSVMEVWLSKVNGRTVCSRCSKDSK